MTRRAYTIGEVAEMTGRHRSTIGKWLKSGALKEVRVPGGERMVSAASLAKLGLVELPPPEAPKTPLKRGRPRIEGPRPWQAEGVSRRTWERRRSAKLPQRMGRADGPAPE